IVAVAAMGAGLVLLALLPTTVAPVAFVIYVLATELPLLQELLRTESMPLQTWLLFGVTASVVIIAMETYKWIQNRRAQTA
ncbi:MAG: hypothetical protein ACK4SA_25210, partial [Caldilinea sp.]